MAESLLREIGQGRFNAYSAGSQPKGRVHPKALELLKSQRMPTEGLSSKAWDVFATPDAPKMDFVITVCDNAAGEACPVWPGQPMTAHWGIPDPAAVKAAKRRSGGHSPMPATCFLRAFACSRACRSRRSIGLPSRGSLDDIGRRPS